ncbi:unannotated protein [freshwater metagenome]|uniref:Unannotated protein n=1 Tax=freshwater metagenome TaxID=449393 RepID=A0A6J7GT35_9ZZZZ|nr:hypothetical protein [Actinomycetota bacterium]
MGTLVIFSINVPRLADFYEAVIGVKRSPSPGDNGKDIRLRSDNEEILIHSIPAKIAKTISLQSPPEAREDTPIKPVFDVDSLADALAEVSLKGGVVMERTFELDGLTRHDVLDTDGNVIQLRSPSGR